eukprot:CAMPEP_0176143894 /NCGR_PEP_ID=MMETSP0120_2-20121206/73246_1 /TAXON_ID=160619 /ORGANISM="Kryptoperidinium foliaceum, Strain CCMP 1326" /LENGTH=448 /DNA_ID=CAMNT_0017480225 /DNA_START=18 /DNA_END=1364 /DNA_ORIENTATION=-
MMKPSCIALFLSTLYSSSTANESGCIAEVDESKDYFPDKVAPENSLHWSVEYYKTYKVVTNEAASEKYILYQCGTQPPSLDGEFAGSYAVPLDEAGVLFTTQLPFLEILGARGKIGAFLGSASWVSSPCVSDLLDEGLIEEVPDPYNVTMIDSQSLERPSFVGHVGGTELNKEIRISVSEEDENLAAFEWIKFYSLFFNLEAKANEIFDATKSRYNCAEENAALLACDNEKRPVVLWGSYSTYCGGWDVATCPNYYCEFAENCQADILHSEDQGSYYSELCYRNYMTTEEFVAFGKDADIWIYPSPDFDNAFADFGDVLSDFVSVQNEQVYDTEGSGANTWFEQRLSEPDVVLQDFCNVVGRENLSVPTPHERSWFRNVFTESVGSLGQCEDPEAPLVPKASECFALPSDYCSKGAGAGGNEEDESSAPRRISFVTAVASLALFFLTI